MSLNRGEVLIKAKTSVLLAGVLLVSLLSLVSSCVPRANDPAAVQAIQKCVDDYVKAMNARETDAAVAMMSDNMVYADINVLAKEWTNSFDGQLMGRAQALAEIKNGAYKLELFKISDLSAHVYGDIAIVTSTVTLKGKYKGSDAPNPQRSLDIFVKRGGRWQAVMTYNTLIKP